MSVSYSWRPAGPVALSTDTLLTIFFFFSGEKRPKRFLEKLLHEMSVSRQCKGWTLVEVTVSITMALQV